LHTITPIQKFLTWLAAQQARADAGQVLAAIKAMPADTVLQRRDRAVMACLILTEARDGALISLRVKHVD